MKKIIRFIIAVVFTPAILLFVSLDWLYETNCDISSDWKKYILFKPVKENKVFANPAEEDLEKLAVKEAEQNV